MQRQTAIHVSIFLALALHGAPTGALAQEPNELVITVMNWAKPLGSQGERMEAWVKGPYAGKDFGLFGMSELHHHNVDQFFVPAPLDCPGTTSPTSAVDCLVSLLNTWQSTTTSPRYAGGLYSEDGIVFQNQIVERISDWMEVDLPRGTFLGVESSFGAGKSIRRAMIGARFKLKATGYTFHFYATHLSPDACSNCRIRGAKRIREVTKEKYIPGDLPPLVVGDFNDYKVERNNWFDDNEHLDVREEMGKSFIDMGQAFGRQIIDHIWVGKPEEFVNSPGGWELRAFVVDASVMDPVTLSNGASSKISDHNAIVGRIRPVACPLVVNSVSSGQQVSPAVAMDANGNFVVVWQDDQNNNGKYQILARGFDANGSPRFSRERTAPVNSVSSGQQVSPAVAMDANGNFVVAWQDDQDGNGKYEILARGFDANGSPRFSRERTAPVNSVSSGQQASPAVAMDANGNFVVAWQDDQGGNGKYEILARGFDANGSPRFSREEPTPVNLAPGGQQYAPRVAMEQTWNSVVVWQDDQDRNGRFEILAQRFDSSGAVTHRAIHLVPDLTVSIRHRSNFPTPPEEPWDLSFTVRIKNEGGAPARPCTLEFVAGQLLPKERTQIPSLDVEEVHEITFLATRLIEGDHGSTARVDVDNEVSESNENNNVAMHGVRVPPRREPRPR